MDPGSGRTAERLNVAAFAVLLVGGGLFFLASPKQSVSSAEKRRLAATPDFALRSVVAGRTGSALDAYYSDHFVGRDTLLGVAARIKAARGVGGGDYQVIDTSKQKTDIIQQPHRAATAAVAATDSDGDYDDIRSVIVYKGKAVQISTGSRSTAARFARMVNDYHRQLGPGVAIYCMAIPVGSDFYLPHAVNNGEMRELKNIQQTYAGLDPGIGAVDAYGELARHAGEYIYYRTDHHWTARGAYYAYRSFAAAADLTPIAPRLLTKGAIPNFLGSLYTYTRSDVLKANVDTLYYYVIPNATTETIYRSRNGRGVPARLYEKTAKGGNAYALFLGGDSAVVRIRSRDAGTRKILVIKDSYGNAFAPYLAANYGEVWVVDYRFFWGSIPQLVKDQHIDDVLFAHNTYVLNGRPAVARELRMLHGGPNGPALSAPGLGDAPDR